MKEKKFYSFLPRNSADNVFCVSKRLIYTIDAGESQAFLILFFVSDPPHQVELKTLSDETKKETERRFRLEEAQKSGSRLVSTFNGVVVNLY